MEIIKDIDMSQAWSLPSRVLQKCKHLGYKMTHEGKVKGTRPEVDTLEQFVHLPHSRPMSQKRSVLLSASSLPSLRSHLTS